MRKIDSIILHHTQTDYDTFDRVKKYHTKNLGWSDIGYHYFIELDGEIKEGRSLLTKGAHCYGHNRTSIGICLVGNTKFNDEQFQSLKRLLVLLMDTRKITKNKIYGHNEFSKKACPGFPVSLIREF